MIYRFTCRNAAIRNIYIVISLKGQFEFWHNMNYFVA